MTFRSKLNTYFSNCLFSIGSSLVSLSQLTDRLDVDLIRPTLDVERHLLMPSALGIGNNK